MAARTGLKVQIFGDAGPYRRELRSAEGATKGFASSIGGSFKQIRNLAIGGGLFVGLEEGLRQTAGAVVDFDKSMRNVNSIAQLSEKQLGKLSSQVLSLAGKTAQAPQTLSEGLYDLVSSGFQANESIKILEASAKAATAGLTDTATSTGAVAAVLNAYQLDASKAAGVSDTLFQTVNRGVISFEDLATKVGDVLPLASSLGVDFNQVGAAISTMTKQGIAAPQSMTKLRGIMTQFVKPSADMTKAIGATGAASAESLIKHKGMQGALEAVIKTTDGSKASIAKLFPDVEALGGALALTGKNAQTAHGDLNAFKNTSGATDTALKQQSKSISYQWQQIKASISGAAIEIGSKAVPPITKFIDQVKKGTGFGGDVRKSVETAKGAFESLSPTVKKITLAVGALGAIFLLTGPVGVAIAAFAGAALLIKNNWDKIGPVFDKVKAAVTEFVRKNVDLDKVKQAVSNVANAVEAVLGVAMEFVLRVAKRVWPGIKQYVEGALKVITGVIRVFSGILTGDFGEAWRGVKQIVSGALNAMLGAVRAWSAPVRELFSTAWGGIKSVFAKAADKILGGFTSMLRGAQTLTEAMAKLPGPLGKPWRKAADAIDGAADTIDGYREKLRGLDGKEVVVKIDQQLIRRGVNAFGLDKDPMDAFNPKTKRRGGVLKRFMGGGLVPSLVSPGELLRFPNGSSGVVPGARVAADNTFLGLPVGTKVFTDDGQALLASGASEAMALAMQAPHFAAGGTVRGKVSYFGPPGDALGTTASGLPSSAPGLALNINAGTDSGWNNATTDAWVKARQPFLVQIGRHRAVLPVIDKGPAGWTGKAIDVTGAGVRALGMDPATFPTGQIGTATMVGKGAKAGVSKAARIAHPRLVDILQPYGSTDAFNQGMQAGITRSRLFKTGRGTDSDLFKSATSGIRANEADLPKKISLRGSQGSGKIPAGVAGSVQAAIALASKMGHAHPSSGQLTGGKHATGSLHYAGRAADFGDAGKSVGSMKALFMALYNKFGSHINELFYDKMPWHLNGFKKVAGPFGGHGDHIHVGFRKGGVARFNGGGAVGKPQSVRKPTSGKGPRVAETPARVLHLVSDASTGMSGAVLEQLRQLGEMIGKAKQVTYSKLGALRTRAMQEIRALAKDGLTGDERVQVRRLRGALTLLEGEMGRRVGLIVGKAQRVLEGLPATRTKTQQRLARGGTDESSVAGLSALISVDQGNLGKLTAQLGDQQRRTGLYAQLDRARAAKNPEAANAIKEAITSYGETIAQLGTDIAVQTRQLAVTKIADAIDSISESFSSVTKIGDDLARQMRVDGVSPDSIAGNQRRLGANSDMASKIQNALIPDALRELLAGWKAGDLGSVKAAADLLAQLRGQVADLGAESAELSRSLTERQRYQPSEVGAAMAQLTSTKSDDLAWAKERQRLLTEDYNAAVARSDEDAILALAPELKSARDSIEGLTQEIAETNRREQEKLDLTKILVEQQGKLINLAESQSPSLMNAIVAVINGGIGPTVGLNMMTPGRAGQVARY